MNAESLWSGMAMAAWLGILTSISPCPLATNIAAISYIGREVEKTSRTLLLGLFYALGRTLVYVLLGTILVSSAHAVPRVSFFLQSKMKLFVGPMLIVVGLVLLDVVKFTFSGTLLSHKAHSRLAQSGGWGALALGAVFALSFCPVSAALFFGSTFGLAARHGSRLLIPAVYGIGTAAPVAAFALALAFSARAVGTLFHKVRTFEKWARRASGVVFLAAGVYIFLWQTIRVF